MGELPMSVLTAAHISEFNAHKEDIQRKKAKIFAEIESFGVTVQWCETVVNMLEELDTEEYEMTWEFELLTEG
jgi:hypothetical protein